MTKEEIKKEIEGRFNSLEGKLEIRVIEYMRTTHITVSTTFLRAEYTKEDLKQKDVKENIFAYYVSGRIRGSHISSEDVDKAFVRSFATRFNNRIKKFRLDFEVIYSYISGLKFKYETISMSSTNVWFNLSGNFRGGFRYAVKDNAIYIYDTNSTAYLYMGKSYLKWIDENFTNPEEHENQKEQEKQLIINN
jgi:hypothetical protein